MRRLWKIAAVATMIGASGCGTILNLTDIDDKGREPYGGYHRDLDCFWGSRSFQFPSAEHPISPGSGKGAIAALVIIPAVVVLYIGCGVTETSLSLLGDACTSPVIPWLDHLAGYDALPSMHPGTAPPKAATMLAPVPLPSTDEPKADQPPDNTDNRPPHAMMP
jgi:hypothetical protein